MLKINGKAGNIRKECNKMGGGEDDYSELNVLDKQFLDICGQLLKTILSWNLQQICHI